jgi:hypothetical protein
MRCHKRARHIFTDDAGIDVGASPGGEGHNYSLAADIQDDELLPNGQSRSPIGVRYVREPLSPWLRAHRARRLQPIATPVG